MAVKAFEQIAKKMEAEANVKKAAAATEKERKRQAAEAEEKRKADAEKFGEIWAFVDEKKKEYPDMSNEMFGKLKECQSKAEAKRVWKTYLSSKEPTEADPGPRWMITV